MHSMIIWPVATDGVAWLVFISLSVSCSHEPCKNGRINPDAIWKVDLKGPSNHVLDGPILAMGRDTFEGDVLRHV